MDLRIHHPHAQLEGPVTLPYAKSVVNRMHIIKALAGKPPKSTDGDVWARDTKILSAALGSSSSIINVEDAGTAYRFLTAYFALVATSPIALLGSGRMYKRPIGPLVDALRSLGALIDYSDQTDYPPLRIYPSRLVSEDVIDLPGHISSQFASALLMIGPYIKKGLRLRLSHRQVSLPYIQMTLDVMRRFGAHIDIRNDVIHVDAHPYRSIDLSPPRDWSSAAFYYCMAGIKPTRIKLMDLAYSTFQGDQKIDDWLLPLGVQSESSSGHILLISSPVHAGERMTIDGRHHPDLIPALVVMSAIKKYDVQFSHIHHLQWKESNRIAALRQELKKFGVGFNSTPSVVQLTYAEPSPSEDIIQVDSHNDHRLAMAFALYGLVQPVIIRDAEVCVKSYPAFWENLKSLDFAVDVL